MSRNPARASGRPGYRTARTGRQTTLATSLLSLEGLCTRNVGLGELSFDKLPSIRPDAVSGLLGANGEIEPTARGVEDPDSSSGSLSNHGLADDFRCKAPLMGEECRRSRFIGEPLGAAPLARYRGWRPANPVLVSCQKPTSASPARQQRYTSRPSRSAGKSTSPASMSLTRIPRS